MTPPPSKRYGSKRPYREEKRSLNSRRFSSVKVILYAFALAAILNIFFIINAIVPSGSMEPEIKSGQAVIGWRLSYLFKEPDRGDIIIFRHEKIKGKLLKRIVGIPGDTVEVRAEGVWINGRHYADCGIQSSREIGTYYVPEESYFLMGDNYDYSLDSRRWDDPFVTRDKIIAKVIFGYFPKVYIIK